MKEEGIGKPLGSVICGAISILLVFMPYFGLPLAIIGTWLSSKQKHSLSTAGKITGIIGITLNSIMLVMLMFILLIVGVTSS